MPPRPLRLFRSAADLLLPACCLGLATLLAPCCCLAGGGPENVLLVVNQNSSESLTVANYYTRLRQIPPQNVLYLDWQGDPAQISGHTFRDKILKPTLETIDRRKLSAQIDYVVYSCDLPMRVNFQDFFPGEKFPKQMRPIASITGATYLWQVVLQEEPTLMGLNTNWYVPDAGVQDLARCAEAANAPTQGFRGRYAWRRGGKREADPSKGPRYFLSCMLGVRHEMGNTVEEIAHCLITATSADASRPRGTFYFARNKDVRSTTRHKCFDAVAAALREDGAMAEVTTGMLPKAAQDVVGLTTGFRKQDVAGAGMRILPGAICDNLTSFGGITDKDLGQTLLTSFIRAGAAGASGTVTEPLAIQAKFPLPTIHLHYFRGCSLAEAFYQSVAGPYQLLVVGDPLCQPWADPPDCDAFNLVDDKLVKGPLEIKPRLSSAAGLCELYVDGRLQGALPRGGKISLDSTKLTDGSHEIRLVAVRNDPIETRGRFTVRVDVRNTAAEPIALSSTPERRVGVDQTLELRVDGDASRYVIQQNSRTIGQAQGTPAVLRIEAAELGQGPVALAAEDPVSGRRSAPIWVWVE
ncbi:hypothetical protein Pla123a_01860 [Posidoniimonas polymericola]|uniref:TIGR03790 family protein n=1 Tax=Posidoniimonas polymericola TaxID=2528002 RepID=A0A5C5ZD87_9BACT|nr:TIGR03790 family protein [Posidoniimonas polymericola]TWT85379.1 hypothetical protein Pla123a_01860 [Posidoniimonas polymericola]